jgi:hypothetical protein
VRFNGERQGFGHNIIERWGHGLVRATPTIDQRADFDVGPGDSAATRISDYGW